MEVNTFSTLNNLPLQTLSKDYSRHCSMLSIGNFLQEVTGACSSCLLVCSQEKGDGRFKEYPPELKPEEDRNNEAVVTRDNSGN